jgi:chromosome partitioning protein
VGVVVAVANQKGGVGKTTTVINLGASLAAAEKRVLLVDFDPQANCTSGMGLSKQDPGPTTYTLLTGDFPAREAVRGTDLPFLSVLPASIALAGAEVELVGVPEREFCLRRALEPIKGDFDYLLVDCPPSLGLLTLNALVAADEVLVPIQAEYFALEGLSELVRTIDRVREHLNPDLRIRGILLTMMDERTNLARQVGREVKNFFGDRLFKTGVPRNIRLAEAPSFGKPALLYDIASRGAQSYLSVATEFLAHEA